MSLKFLIIDDHAEYRRLLSYHVAAHWPEARAPVALVRPAAYSELVRMGVPLRVIYTSRSYVAVVRP